MRCSAAFIYYRTRDTENNHSEARVVSQIPGKAKSPVLLATSLARAIGFETDGYALTTRDSAMGQQPFDAPSVFGFYPDNFPLPQGAGILSPASKLITTSMNLILLNGTMTAPQRSAMASAMAQIKNADAAIQARRRAQTAIYIAAASPLFQVDR